MKFLLMSQALENDSIKQALQDLLGKSFSESKVAIVTTSSNPVFGDKRWLIKMINQFDEVGFETVDILDFAGLPEDVWLPRLEKADVLMFTGGNSTHLANEMRKVGMKERLDKLLETRVYASNSAGSIVTCASLAMANDKHFSYSEQAQIPEDLTSLHYHPFHLRPHWNHPEHSASTEAWVEARIAERNVTDPVYLIDDQTALKVVDGEVEVISEGEYKIYNQ